MFARRLIPCLLLRGQGLVKTVRFGSPAYIGDPINAVRIFNDKFVDGQFNECALTKMDFERIAASLGKTLSSMYHSRVTYPEDLEGMVGSQAGKEEPDREGSVTETQKAKEEFEHGASVG